MRKALTTFFVVCFSFVIVEATEPDQQALFQAHTDLFRSVLKGVRQSLTSPPPVSLFVSYSHDNEVHKRRVEALCEDLTSIGIPFGNIIFDQWSNRPAGHINIYQNVDKILGAERVILVGSTPLREKYEATEQRGIVSDEISRLRDRIREKGQEGIIPVWFEESFEACFPQGIRHIVGRSLSDDYHASFFDLVIDLYQLDANDNPVKFLKQQFMERRNISVTVLTDYGNRLLRFQEKRIKREEDAVREILEAAQQEREGQLRGNGNALTESIFEVQELKRHNRRGNIEITPGNEKEIKRLADLKQQAFKEYDRGIYVRGWKSSAGGAELLEILLKFTNIKRLKVEIEWEREKEEKEIIEMIEKVTSSYPYLEELDLSNCRLINLQLFGILDGLRDAERLKRLIIKENYFEYEIIQTIKQKLPKLEGLEIEEEEYSSLVNAVQWQGPSKLYQLYYRASLGHKQEYDELMAMSLSEDPLALSYCLLLSFLPENRFRKGEIDIEGISMLVKKVNVSQLYERAATGDLEAQNGLGIVSVASDSSTIKKMMKGTSGYRWCRKAANMGFIEAKVTLFYFCNTNSDIDAAIEHCVQAGEKGHAGALFILGSLLYRKQLERSVSREEKSLVLKRSFACIEEAAELDHVKAQFDVGKTCEELVVASEQLEMTEEKSQLQSKMLKWYKRAAENGHEGAILKLRKMGLSSEIVSLTHPTSSSPRNTPASSTPPSQRKERNYLEEKQRLEERFGFGAQWQEEDKRDFWSKFIQLDKTTREAFKQKWDTDADDWIQLYPTLSESERLNFFQDI